MPSRSLGWFVLKGLFSQQRNYRRRREREWSECLSEMLASRRVPLLILFVRRRLRVGEDRYSESGEGFVKVRETPRRAFEACGEGADRRIRHCHGRARQKGAVFFALMRNPHELFNYPRGGEGDVWRVQTGRAALPDCSFGSLKWGNTIVLYLKCVRGFQGYALTPAKVAHGFISKQQSLADSSLLSECVYYCEMNPNATSSGVRAYP